MYNKLMGRYEKDNDQLGKGLGKGLSEGLKEFRDVLGTKILK
jgi:hypothetical protein